MSALTTPSARRSGPLPGGRNGGRRGREGLWGWLFVTPAVTVLGLFLLAPILMALWVSLLDWDGQSNPFTGTENFVGLDNYADLLARDGLDREQLMTSLRNNFFYVLLVVPLQTVVSLGLALAVNQRVLKAKSAYRTAFYFPSVTSSIAISTIFLFLFQGSGAVNTVLSHVGVDGPNWFTDARGLTWVVLDGLGLVDAARPPQALAGNEVLGLSWWDWLAGPSVAMTTIILLAVWTTSGTFMLIFLAALQDVPAELEEAARIDGCGRWGVFRHVTLPALRPVTFLVLTLGLIATWQVFDQVYVMSQGAPANTTLTPAYLSYTEGFDNAQYGKGAAIAFLLLAIILVFTALQRYVLRDRDAEGTTRKQRSRTR
ncbi:sugar ABC transporter permease [Streptomyces sp. RKND-216]|uniref:carbohydrate ABC transporter permease n=1 Tax=Streptomyces sp. RKND-216 TaxID=2562581 RepID=UPI00109E285F|nr:sugar ABC transporter permease [Streptomyces sp. RKND-216]THA24359.1 sugar ABC transporter permease [Streptomyces sp. RKND-216]